MTDTTVLIPFSLAFALGRCVSYTQAISYVKPVLVSGNRGFSTFAGVFEQGNGRIGLAFLEVPPVICERHATPFAVSSF